MLPLSNAKKCLEIGHSKIKPVQFSYICVEVVMYQSNVFRNRQKYLKRHDFKVEDYSIIR